MRKKPTSHINKGLSATQHDAIRLLVSGCTARYTALVLKLDYATVRRWIKQDAQFQKTLALQNEQQKAQPSVPASQPRRKKIPTDQNSGVTPKTVKSRGRIVPG